MNDKVPYKKFEELFKQLIEGDDKLVDTLDRSNEGIDLDKAKFSESVELKK